MFIPSGWLRMENLFPFRVSLRTRGGKLVTINQPVELSELEGAAQEITMQASTSLYSFKSTGF
jgi:hypothetical protein